MRLVPLVGTRRVSLDVDLREMMPQRHVRSHYNSKISLAQPFGEKDEI